MPVNLVINRSTTFLATNISHDFDEVGQYDPGDVLFTRITITNYGTTAANDVEIQDSFVSDSFGSTLVTGKLNVSPIAFNDAFDAVGNTVLRVGGAANIGTGPSLQVAGNLLSNDRGSSAFPSGGGVIVGDSVPGFTIDAGSGQTTLANALGQKGTFTVFSDGSFNYVSAPGASGMPPLPGDTYAKDTFTYTIRDVGLDNTANTADDLLSTATVTITLKGEVWYVDSVNGSDATGTGTSANPYKTLTKLNGDTGDGSTNDDVDGAGDTIYVKGTNNTTGSITLESNQQLLGTGAALVVEGFTLATAGATSQVSSALSSGYAVTLGSNNTVAGLQIVGTGLNTGGITGTNFGTVTLDNTGGGSLNTTGTALNLSGGTVAGNGFSSTTSSGGTNNVSLSNVDGTVTLGTGSMTNATATGVTIQGGGATVRYNGSITHTAEAFAVDIANKSGGTVTFFGAVNANTSSNGIRLDNNDAATIEFRGGLTLNTNTANAFTATNGGTVGISGSANTITTTTGTAVTITDTTIGSLGVTLQSVNVNGASSGIVLTNSGNGFFRLTGDATGARNGSGGTIQNTTDDGIRLTNANNVTIRSVNLTNTGDQPAAVNLGTDSTTASGEHAVQITGGSNIILNGLLITDPGATGILALDVAGINRVNSDTRITGQVAGSGHGVYINNTNASATLWQLDDIEITNGLSSASGVYATNGGSATLRLDIKNSLFENLDVQAVTVTAGNTAGTTGSVSSTITGNIFRNGREVSGSAVGENNLGVLVSNGATHTTLVSGNTFNNVAEDGTIANTSIIRTQNAGGVLNATVTGNTVENISYATGGRHVIGHIFEPVTYSAAYQSNLNITNNVVTGVTYLASTNREFVFVDYRANAGGGDIIVQNNTSVNMPSAGTQQLLEFRFRQTNASTVDLLIHNNTVTGNTAGVFLDVDAEAASTVNATITNNTFTNSNGTPGFTLDVATEAATSVMNTSISGNNFTAAGNTINLNETAGDLNVTQVTAAGVSAANNAATVTVVGSPDYAQPMPTQPTAPSTPSVAPLMATEEPGAGSRVDETAGGDAEGETANSPTTTQSGPTVVDDGVISAAELQLIVDAAIARWEAAGATAEQLTAMRAVSVTVSDLGGLYLGSSNAGTITIDDDAAGWRWFIDATPGDDSEFAGSGTRLSASDGYGAAGTRVDLLTVVMHELGHQIGLADSYDAGERDELMYGAVGAGERRLPGGDDLDHASDAPVVGAFAALPIEIGTLPAGQSVTIDYHSTVNMPTAGLVGHITGQTTVITDAGIFQSDDNLATANTAEPNILLIDGLALGNRVYRDVNKNGYFDAGDIGIANVLLKIYIDSNNNGAGNNGWDPGIDLYVGYNELGGGAGYQQGTDTPAPAGTGTQLTATTDANGLYSFGPLAPGNYIVVIDASNFTVDPNGVNSGPLAKMVPASYAADPDNDVDDDDDTNFNAANNGYVYDANGDFTWDYIVSEAITLSYGAETTAGPTGPALDTNDTLDFTFELPNQPPTATGLANDTAVYTEDGPAVFVDVGQNVDLTDGDSPDFNGGSLRVEFVNGSATASEDALAIAGTAAISVSGGKVFYDGGSGAVEIGTVAAAGGAGGGHILVNFTSTAATQAAVEALIKAIVYSNSDSETPDVTQRSVKFTLKDGDGIANGGNDTLEVTSMVNVVAVNDAPSGDDAEKTINEDSTYTFKYDPAADPPVNDFPFSDPDGHIFGGIRIVSPPSVGTMMLNGVVVGANTVVTAAQIQAGLLTYTPALNASGTPYASFTFKVIDSGGGTSPDVNEDPFADTFTFNVNAVNDAPVIDLNGATAGINNTASYTEDGAAFVLSNVLLVTDVDSSSLTGATVKITGFQAGDLLTIVGLQSGTTFGLNFSYDATTGVMTFTGESTPNAYRSALRTVQFSSTHQNPNTTRTIEWTVTDGTATSAAATTTVTVTPVDDAPTSANKTVQTSEDDAYTFQLTDFAFNDVDGNQLTSIRITQLPVFGELRLNGSAVADEQEIAVADIPNLTFVPAQDQFGSPYAAFTFRAIDNGSTANGGANVSPEYTITVNVTPDNLPPALDLNGGGSGIDNDAAYTEQAATATVLAPSLTVSDGNDTNIESATVSITAGFQTLKDSLTVNGATGPGTVSGIDFSYNAASGVLTLTGPATLATFEAVLRQVGFSSTSDAPGTSRSITWTINDGDVSSTAAVTSVTVTPVNDAPSGTSSTITIAEDTTRILKAEDFGFSDVDGDGLQAVTIVSVTGGSLYYDEDGANGNPPVLVRPQDFPIVFTADYFAQDKVTFVPTAHANGTGAAAITFRVVDDSGEAFNTDQSDNVITVDVTAVNDAPVLTSATSPVAANEQTAVAIVAGVTVSDADLDALNGGNGNYAGAQFSVNRNSSANSEDVFTVVNGANFTNDGGVLKSGGLAFATINVNGNGLIVITFTSSQTIATSALVDEVIQSVRYTNSSDTPPASVVLAYGFVDGGGSGNQGSGGQKIDVKLVTVNITSLNDAPVNTVPGATQNGTEDTDLVFSTAKGNAISVADADAAGGDLTVTLTVSNGKLTLATLSGLTTVTGDGTGSVSLTGSAAEINAALDGLVYRGNLNYQGADTLTIVTSDNGRSGSDGTKTDTDQIAIALEDDGYITGDTGSNVLNGTPNRDYFRVEQGGNDTVNGLGGNDTFFFGGAFTAGDTVNGGDGVDSIILQGNYSAGVTLGTGLTSNISGVESISLAPGNFTDWGDTSNQNYSYSLTMLDSNVGSGGIFKVNGFWLRAGENLTFNGQAEANATFLILGGQGVDTITGGGGNDIFAFGHDGRFGAGDVVTGGAGYDTLYLRGAYTINFNSAGFAGSIVGIESVTLGHQAEDQFTAGGSGDFDYSFTWNDSMLATGSTITFNGSSLAATQTLSFDGSLEIGGKFRLFGGAAGDTLTGGGGADYIYGGLGADQMTGNGGADQFVYFSTAESVTGAGNFDTIKDFEHDIDKIDLSFIDAKSFSGGDQDFQFIGAAAFSGSGNSSAGQLRAFLFNSGTNTWQVEGDTDGNGSADIMFQVIVQAGQSLTGSDFVL